MSKKKKLFLKGISPYSSLYANSLLGASQLGTSALGPGMSLGAAYNNLGAMGLGSSAYNLGAMGLGSSAAALKGERMK